MERKYYFIENQGEGCSIQDALWREYKTGSTEVTSHFNLENEAGFLPQGEKPTRSLKRN